MLPTIQNNTPGSHSILVVFYGVLFIEHILNVFDKHYKTTARTI